MKTITFEEAKDGIKEFIRDNYESENVWEGIDDYHVSYPEFEVLRALYDFQQSNLDRIKELEAELKRLIDTYEGLDYEDYEMGTAIKQAKELLK